MKIKMTAIAMTILAISGAMVAFAFDHTNDLSTVAQRSQPSEGINDGQPLPRGRR